jgi:hypothetical protein
MMRLSYTAFQGSGKSLISNKISMVEAVGVELFHTLLNV